MVLGPIRQTRSMAILTSGHGVNVYDDGFVANGAVNTDIAGDFVVAIFGFTLVAIVAIGRARCVGVASLTISAIQCSVGVVSATRILVGTPEGRVMAAFATGHRLNVSVAGLTGDAVGTGGGVVLGTDAAGVTGQTAIPHNHRGMTGLTVDRINNPRSTRVIRDRHVVRGLNLALVAGQTLGQLTDTGMALGTVTALSGNCLMVRILLRHKGMTLGTVATGGHPDVTLVTEPLLVGCRRMVT